ncbi:MAG TPA: hypothetical protein VNA25_19390, partial [Phycisphaerae bacterium]|nr:hypothetical protein [Phycisphaerae bacterium]
MRRWINGILVVTVISLVAGSAAGQPTQLLSNTSFEAGPTPILLPDKDLVPPDGMGSMPDDWTLTRMNNHDPNGHDFGRGAYYIDGAQGDPNVAARTGDRFIMSEYRWWFDGGTAEQTVTVPPGTYDLELSFYGVVWDATPYISHLSGEIIVDGEVVAAGHLASRNEWITDYRKVTASWKGQVSGEITVRFSLLANGLDGGVNPNRSGFIALDDVELWSRACGTQHEVDDINPNVIDFVSVPAEATVTISGTIADTDTIEIDTGGVNRVYEFDTNSILENGGDVAVDVSAAQDKASAKAALILAINGDAENVPCSASDPDPGEDVTLLTWDTNGGDGATNDNINDTNLVIEVTNFAQPAQSSNTITITGSSLTNVDVVRLWRNGFDESTVEIVGSSLSTGATAVTAEFVT